MTPEEKAALQKLFTQQIGNYGVNQFNLRALTEDGERIYESIQDIKAKLEAERDNPTTETVTKPAKKKSKK